jgi:lysophospholipase L1-like esterase
MGYPPVVVVESGGVPRTQVAEGGSAPAYTVVESGARPITLADNAPPIALFNEDGTPYTDGGGVPLPTDGPIAAFGDSLTNGTGATDAITDSYGAVAEATLGRDVVVLGIGGQTSTQIAARQGGVPIEVTVTGDSLASMTGVVEPVHDFTSGSTGWFEYGAATIGAVDGKLETTCTGFGGAMLTNLANVVPMGRFISITADIVVHSGELLVATLDNGFAACGDPAIYTYEGTQTVRITANLADAERLLFYMNGAGSFSLDNVLVSYPTADVTVAVTSKSVNILEEAGSFTGVAYGSLAGVTGRMTTDGSGNWTFRRLEAGGVTSIPSGTPFILETAVEFQEREQWLWAGSNDVASLSTVLDNIAAMVAYLGHTHYRILSVLPGFGTAAQAQAVNSALQAAYGSRFVNVFAALQAENDGSGDDLADVASGLVPRSLRSDALHLNTAGYAIVSAAVLASR